jgi:hypothetical protein
MLLPADTWSFFRHVAPQLISEYTDEPSYKRSNSQRLRTWGSMSARHKRQFDTLMNTVNESENKDDIPLKLRGDSKRLNELNTRVDVMRVKGDDDSEEAILFERTVQVTHENTKEQTKHDQTHVGGKLGLRKLKNN